jgi:hypothetical protein
VTFPQKILTELRLVDNAFINQGEGGGYKHLFLTEQKPPAEIPPVAFLLTNWIVTATLSSIRIDRHNASIFVVGQFRHLDAALAVGAR